MFKTGFEGLNRNDPIKKQAAITLNRLCLLGCITAVAIGIVLIILKMT